MYFLSCIYLSFITVKLTNAGKLEVIRDMEVKDSNETPPKVFTWPFSVTTRIYLTSTSTMIEPDVDHVDNRLSISWSVKITCVFPYLFFPIWDTPQKSIESKAAQGAKKSARAPEGRVVASGWYIVSIMMRKFTRRLQRILTIMLDDPRANWTYHNLNVDFYLRFLLNFRI